MVAEIQSDYDARGHANVALVGNDHDATHLQTKAVPLNLIWNESSLLLLSSSVRKVSRVIITPLSTPIGPNGQITITLHIHSSCQVSLIFLGKGGEQK